MNRFKEMSDRNCPKCGRPIKKSVATRKSARKVIVCFRCFRESSQELIRTAREIRRDPSLRSKKRERFPLRTIAAN